MRTLAIVILAAVAVVGAVWTWRRTGAPAEPTSIAQPATGAQPREPSTAFDPLLQPASAARVPSADAPRSAEPAPLQLASPTAISGVVIDPAGAAVAAAVWVEAAARPASHAREPWPAEVGGVAGLVFATDAQGRFALELGRTGTVTLCALPAPGGSMTIGRGELVLVTPPASQVELRVPRRAGVEITIRLVSRGPAPSDEFLVFIRGERGGPATQRRTIDRELVLEFPLARPGDLHVGWLDDQRKVREERTVFCVPGQRQLVEFTLDPTHELVGRVVDPRGGSIEGAHVFFGIANSGSELFDAFHPDPARGVRTDASGEYRLRGSGEVVTVWHPRHATQSVALSAARVIVLEPRGRIVCTLPGRPQRIELDGAAVTPSHLSDLECILADVDPGWRSIALHPGGTYAVEVRAAEDARLDLTRAIARVEVELVRDPAAVGQAPQGFAVSLERGGSVLAFDSSVGRADWEHVIPGRYALCAESGFAVELRIDGPHARVEFGGSVDVVARPGTRALLCPSGWSEIERARVAVCAREVGKDGRLRISDVPAGSYVLAGNGGVVLCARVEVPRSGTVETRVE